MKTYSAKASDISRKWYIIDAEGQTLGRVATYVSRLLIGKHKPMYTPNIDNGDFIVVINSAKIVLTGNKENVKEYYSHSGYSGAGKTISYQQMMERHPEKVMFHAVSGMLPKNKMRNRRLKRLKVFIGSEHTHNAQQPEVVSLNNVK